MLGFRETVSHYVFEFYDGFHPAIMNGTPSPPQTHFILDKAMCSIV